MSTMSREEYLKRYMSSDSADKQKKKSTKAVATTATGRGMRFLDEDTFIQSKPGSKMRRLPAEDGEEDIGLEEEEEEEDELDEIERAIRKLNSKSAVKKKSQGAGAEPSFKTDSFVTVEGPSEPSTQEGEEDGSSPKSPSRKAKAKSKEVKTEVKDEPQSEGEEEDRTEVRRRKRMDDGRKAGLVSKQAMKEEMRELGKRAQEGGERPKKGDGASAEGEQGRDEGGTRKRVTGFNRDARKKRQNGEEDGAETEARKAREAAKQAEMEAKYAGWNRGVAQKRERDEQLQEMERTLTEGFTRYADDEAMNEHLKEQMHEEDPMAEYFRVKNHKVQMRTGIVYPTYGGQWAPNRYGIAPGYRWDGVDRSNGFESKLALEKNRKLAREKDTYRAIQECEQ